MCLLCVLFGVFERGLWLASAMGGKFPWVDGGGMGSRGIPWRMPKSMNEVQCFVGLVKYLAQFMPEVSVYAMPLTGIQRNRHPFKWKEVHH